MNLQLVKAEKLIPKVTIRVNRSDNGYIANTSIDYGAIKMGNEYASYGRSSTEALGNLIDKLPFQEFMIVKIEK